MTLVDELLKSDAKKAGELETGVYKSKKLANILGIEGKVDVAIHEIDSRLLNDIVAYQLDKKGQFDFSKSFDAKLMMCVEGISEPALTNKELQSHFGCDNAKDLTEKLFGAEINEISDAISALSGLTNNNDEDEEEEIKNS